MGALTFGFQSIMKIHSLVLDLILLFYIMCTQIFLELLVKKLFLFRNNVINFFNNMTFKPKMIINLLSLVATHQVEFYKVLN
jgi:hypothetical protein